MFKERCYSQLSAPSSKLRKLLLASEKREGHPLKREGHEPHVQKGVGISPARTLRPLYKSSSLIPRAVSGEAPALRRSVLDTTVVPKPAVSICIRHANIVPKGQGQGQFLYLFC